MLSRFNKSRPKLRTMMPYLLFTISNKRGHRLRVVGLIPSDLRKGILNRLGTIISNHNKIMSLLTWSETINKLGPNLNPKLNRTGHNLLFNRMSIRERKCARWFLASRLPCKATSSRCTSTKRRTFRIITGISRSQITSPEMKISD